MRQQPIDGVTWVPIEKLDPNDYNPNVVFDQELKLLEFSLLKTGWVHPILVCRNPKYEERDVCITGTKEIVATVQIPSRKPYLIVDGFHRWWLAKNRQQVWDMTFGVVPVVVLDLSEPDRMMLTIRINRAKGAHIALKMSEVIKRLVKDHGIPPEVICKQIGAPQDEIELLLMENVFESKDIKNHQYSKAWVPDPKGGAKK